MCHAKGPGSIHGVSHYGSDFIRGKTHKMLPSVNLHYLSLNMFMYNPAEMQDLRSGTTIAGFEPATFGSVLCSEAGEGQ